MNNRSDDRRITPPQMPGGQTMVGSRTRTSMFSAGRFASSNPLGLIEATMPPEDAFVVLLEMRDQSEHWFSREGKTLRAGAMTSGTVHIVDLSAEHRCFLTEPVDSLAFHLPRAALDDIAEEAGAPRIGGLRTADPWNTRDPVLLQLQAYFVGRLGAPEAGDLAFDHIQLGLAAHLARTYGGMRADTPAARGGLSPWQQRIAKELLADSDSAALSLAAIASECGLSPAYFGRAFKRSTGQTPHEWRQRSRIARAKDLLRDPALALAGIAGACGFADQSHFSRVFTQQTGQGPAAWRREHAPAKASAAGLARNPTNHAANLQ